MNPLLLLALAGGGYVLYQQSQGRSIFGDEPCPSKIYIDGNSFVREIVPGYENGGTLTEALNACGILMKGADSFELNEGKGKLKKFLSANYTRKLADKIFRKLVPKGCKKSDKGTVVCIPLMRAGAGDQVVMLEMHLPTFWVLVHSVLIGTFGKFFVALEEVEKAAACQALVGKELDWWRKTMDLEGDINDDIKSSVVPMGEHKPADFSADAAAFPFASMMGMGDAPPTGDENGGHSNSQGTPGKYGPMGSPSAYILTRKVAEGLEYAAGQISSSTRSLPEDAKSELLSSRARLRLYAESALDNVMGSYTDASVGQKITKQIPSTDTQTPFEAEGPGASIIAVSPASQYVAILREIIMGLELVDRWDQVSASSRMKFMEEVARVFGKSGERAMFRGDRDFLESLDMGGPRNA